MPASPCPARVSGRSLAEHISDELGNASAVRQVAKKCAAPETAPAKGWKGTAPRKGGKSAPRLVGASQRPSKALSASGRIDTRGKSLPSILGHPGAISGHVRHPAKDAHAVSALQSTPANRPVSRFCPNAGQKRPSPSPACCAPPPSMPYHGGKRPGPKCSGKGATI